MQLQSIKNYLILVLKMKVENIRFIFQRLAEFIAILVIWNDSEPI
jgi:hypothetical protein